MKILYSYRTEEERNRAAEALGQYEVFYHEGSLQKGSWDGKGVDIACVFVDSVIGPSELEKLPDLKFIATKSTGFDHIDLKSAKERKIVVSNVPAYGEHTVAEFTFALILMLTRNMYQAHERVTKEGSFNANSLAGTDLFGKTIGILGTGRIGRNVIKIAKGFGMNVIAMDLYPNKNLAKEEGFKYLKLEEVLATADIVSLHLPEDKTTHHIINKDKIGKMKKYALGVLTN